MKNTLLAVLAMVLLCSTIAPAVAGGTDEIPAELKPLFSQITEKLKAGKKTEADFADELKAFDALIAKHKGEKTDEVAMMVFIKAMLYEEVLDDSKKSDAMVAQLKLDYPDTKIVKEIAARDEGKKVAASLVAGVKFPEFAEQDTTGKPLALSGYKGKVVLVDFWATWCGPCVGEVPNVVKIYDKYHTNGFEVIGVSLDTDKAKLESFTKDKGMVWPQFFDGQEFNNKLAAKYGVDAIPMTYLLDGEGNIIASDLRGDALEAAVAKALTKK